MDLPSHKPLIESETILMNKPKTDCFAYSGESTRCNALSELLCVKGKCAFYKTHEQAEQTRAMAAEKIGYDYLGKDRSEYQRAYRERKKALKT